MRIGIVFGGPSGEREISINSARTAMDHLNTLGWEVTPFYCDSKFNYYKIKDSSLLYSNTPFDFDYKKNRGTIADYLKEDEFIRECKNLDIMFPLIHGRFGEDGGIQRLFESKHIPYVGTSADKCEECFDKVKAKGKMKRNGIPTLSYCVIRRGDSDEKRLESVEDLFHKAKAEKYVVKPSLSGSKYWYLGR